MGERDKTDGRRDLMIRVSDRLTMQVNTRSPVYQGDLLTANSKGELIRFRWSRHKTRLMYIATRDENVNSSGYRIVDVRIPTGRMR